MNIKYRNKIITLLIAILLILGIIVYIPTISAADANGTDIAPSYISTNSSATAMIKLDTSTSAGDELKKVNLSFTGSGFATSDLKALSNDATSGVSIFLDDGDDSWEGSPDDGQCTLSVIPTWNDKNVSLTVTSGLSLSDTYYVVIRTSGTIADTDVINVTVTGMTNRSDMTVTLGGTVTAEITSDIIDPVVPDSTLTSPNGGENWSGTHTITWNNASITDSNLGSTPITLKYSTNGGTSWTDIATGEINDGEYSWDTSAGGDSSNYLINLTVTDSAGRSSYDLSNGTFTVDNTAPTCSIEYNNSASFFKAGTKIKIYANFTEATSGMNNATVNISISTQGDGDLSETNMNMTNITNYFWNWTIPSGTEDNGTFTVTITAKDNATNPLGSTTDDSKSVDNSGPSATIGVPVNSNYYQILNTINGSCNDGPGSGVSTVNITIYNTTSGKYWNFSSGWASGVNWTSTTVGATYLTWSFDSNGVTWQNGTTYIVNATATDNVSNIGSPDSNNFTFDTDGISSSVTKITPYWQTTSPLSITYTAHDAGSGLKNVTLYYKFSLDNGSFDPWVVWTNNSNPDITPWDPVTWSFNFPNGSGYYEFYTIAKDNVTNLETKTVNDTICGYDAVDPTAVIIEPQDGGFNKSGDTIVGNITGTAYDPQFVTLVNLTIYNSTNGKYFNGADWVEDSVNLSANSTSGTATINWWYDNVSAFPTWENNKSYVINVSAKDTAGNWNLTAATASFTYDTTDPAVPTISIPTDATWYKSLTNISGTALDNGGSKIASVNIMIYNLTNGKYWTGTVWSDSDTNISANVTGSSWTKDWYFENAATFPTFVNGTNYTINASAVDNAGNVGANASNTFYYDDNGLTSSVNAITTYWQTSENITITATASDIGSGVAQVALYYHHSTDNTSFNNSILAATNTSPWIDLNAISFSFNFSNQNGSGYYRFYTIATDNASNTESSSPPATNDTECGYDPNNSTVEITIPVSGNYYTSMNWINGTCSDTGYSGINRVNYTVYNVTGGTYWNGASWASGTNWSISTLNGPHTSWSNDTSAITWQDTVTYIINATAVDNATRSSTVDSNTFTIDTSAPTVTIEMNESTYVKQGGLVRIYANFTEATSGINASTVNISVKNASLGTLLSYGTYGNGALRTDGTHYYYDWTVPSGNDGKVNVSVVATDNVSYSISGVFYNLTKYIDNTAPILTTGIEFDNAETYYNTTDTVRIFANFTEDTSGIDPTTVKVTIVNITGGTTILNDSAAMSRTDSTHYYFDWSIPDDQNCQVNISIEAADNVTLSLSVDNFTTSKYIDNIVPQVNISDPSNAVYKDESFINITGTATDDRSGITSVTITIYNSTGGKYWDGTDWLDVAANLDTNESGTGTSITWYYEDASTFPTWVDGSNYTINASVTDNADNYNNNYDSNMFYYDDGGPTISNVLITNVNTSSILYISDGVTINVTANVTDANLGASDKNYIKADLTEVGGNAATNATGYDGAVAYWLVTNIDCTPDDGPITITINASDKSGNYATEVNDTITADNTAPTLNYAVLDADNDGTDYTFVDLYFTEDHMDISTIAYTDFNISISGVSPAAINSTSGNRTTIRFDTTFQTGDSPTIGIAGSVADLAGNTLTTGTTIILTYRLSLSSELNLISFPCDVSTEELTTVLSSITGSWQIYRYNATATQWQYYNSDTGYWPVGIQWNLSGGEGYWLSIGSAQNLDGSYDLWPEPGYTMPSYTLKGQSWNLVGQWQSYNQSASTSAGGALACLEDTDIGSVWRYNTGGGYSNIFTDNQNMEPGKGYWIWKESTGDKAYTPN